jgi:glycosyltransferase involved in cell wall biosynthesis
VVVHDQSEPDHTLATTAWRDRGDRSVVVTTNRCTPGLAGARNTGIRAASGELVAFCDDDDYWLPGKLRRQVPALMAHPDATLSTCGIRVEYDGDVHPRSLPDTEVTFPMLLADRHTELHPSTFLLRKQPHLDGIGLVGEDVPGGFGEDYEFLLRTARHHPLVNVPEPLTVIRWGKQSFFFRRWETMAAGLSWLLERYPEFESSRRGSARIQGQIAFAHAAMGNRRTAARWAGRAFRNSPREARAALALAVASGAVKPGWVMEALHKRGRGI